MKYLIDKQMYDAIVWMLPDATPIKEMVSALKPIEPLTIEQIEECCTTEVNRTEINFCRAIEAHILGEKT